MEEPIIQLTEEKDANQSDESKTLQNETEQSPLEPRFSSFLHDTQDFESQRVSLASEKEFDDVFSLKRMGYFIRPQNSASERSDSTANLPSSFYTSQRPTRPESYALTSSEDANSLMHLRSQTTFSPEQMRLPVKTAKFSNGDLSFTKKADPLAALLNQLVLKKERQESLKSYCESVKQQIQESLRINIAELQSKRNSLVAKLDLYLEESIHLAKQMEAKKQAELYKKQSELEAYNEEIDSLIEKLKNRDENDERNVSQILREAKNVLKGKSDENFSNGKWVWDKSIDFNYDVTKKDKTIILTNPENRKFRNKSSNITMARYERTNCTIDTSMNSESKCKHCSKKHTRNAGEKSEGYYPKKTLSTRFLEHDTESIRESVLSISQLNTSNIFDFKL